MSRVLRSDSLSSLASWLPHKHTKGTYKLQTFGDYTAYEPQNYQRFERQEPSVGPVLHPLITTHPIELVVSTFARRHKQFIYI